MGFLLVVIQNIAYRKQLFCWAVSMDCDIYNYPVWIRALCNNLQHDQIFNKEPAWNNGKEPKKFIMRLHCFWIQCFKQMNKWDIYIFSFIPEINSKTKLRNEKWQNQGNKHDNIIVKFSPQFIFLISQIRLFNNTRHNTYSLLLFFIHLNFLFM